MAEKKFGGLPRQAGVSLIGGGNPLVLDGSRGRRGPTPAPPKKSKRLLRSDQRKVQYEMLMSQDRPEEARALMRGAHPAARRSRRTDDAQHLVDTGQARSVDTGQPIAPGSPVPRVVAGPLSHRQGPTPDAFVFVSSDGASYSLPKSMGNPKDKESMWRAGITNSVNVLMLALREIGVGGDPIAVFDQCGVALKDMHGQSLFPIPPELRGVRPQYEYVAEPEPEEEAFGDQLDHGVTADFGAPVEEVPFGEEFSDVGDAEAGFAAGFDNYDDEHLGPYADTVAPEVHPVDQLKATLADIDPAQFEAALASLGPERLRQLGFNVGDDSADVDDGQPIDPAGYGDPEVED